MENVVVILKKQLKDTLKNKALLIQFVMFPALCIFMKSSIKIEGMPVNFFAELFASMYVGMAPLVSMSSIISEEKEKNTLRVLLMADVKPWQYLLGIGCCVFAACIPGSFVFCLLLDGVSCADRLLFLLIMALGIISSIMLGAAIGTLCRDQMSAMSVTVPVMMVFSFLPMMSVFNNTVAGAAKYIYSEQIRLMISSLGRSADYTENIRIVSVNIVIFAVLFRTAYKKIRSTG